jgi:hypothetical protein
VAAAIDFRSEREHGADERRAALEQRLQAILERLDAAASAEVGALSAHESREHASWPVRVRKGERGWLIALSTEACEQEGAEAVLEGILSQALRLLDRYRPRMEGAEGPPAP